VFHWFWFRNFSVIIQVALDLTVIEEIPLIQEYSPEFDIDFEALVLPERSQMVRLAAIECYIGTRISASHSRISIFRFEENALSFSARYFADVQGYQLCQLRTKILAQAEHDLTEKRQEHARKSNEYDGLIRKVNQMNHDYYTSTDRWGFESTHHSHGCTRCSLKRQADGINICIFEWPLPEAEVLSAMVMVELCTPFLFSQWRDISWSLSRSFSASSRDFDRPSVILSEYSELWSFFSSPSTQRLTIASRNAQSHSASHYATQHFPCLIDSVIKKHPLRYQLYDRFRSEWLADLGKLSISIRGFCTPSLPPETSIQKYSNFGWALTSTTHTSNTVIARQSTCLEGLTLHEYLAFGHLRAGTRIQWYNIAAELLHADSLGDEAAYVLFRHAACQAEAADGSGSVEREAHCVLKERRYGLELLEVMDKRLKSTQHNWNRSWTFTILSCVACRLVQLTDDLEVQMSSLNFLGRLRDVLLEFTDDVLQSIRDAVPSSRAQLRTRLVQLAATCRSTFQVGRFMDDVLSDSQSVFHFIYNAILLASNTPAGPSSFTPGLRALLEADVILGVTQLRRLRTVLAEDHAPLDKAILKSWGGYVREANWRNIGDRWVGCWTPDGVGRRSRAVHFNLLNGTLRVDGKALDILPKDIVQDLFYQSIFPNQVSALASILQILYRRLMHL
jgi:hypothetical protein